MTLLTGKRSGHDANVRHATKPARTAKADARTTVAQRPTGPKRYVAAKPLARFIPDLTKTAFQKHGFSSVALIAEWRQIIGLPHAEHCIPERLKWPRKAQPDAESGVRAGPAGATLIVRADAANALEIEYAGAQIVERINAYFGYQAIATLKIVQGPLAAMKRGAPKRRQQARHPAPTAPADDPCKGLIARIEDEALKTALQKMHDSVLGNV